MYKKIIGVLAVLAVCMVSNVQAEMNGQNRPTYTIAVAFADRILRVYDPVGNELFSCKVAVPRAPMRLPIKGKVVAIERDPWWTPLPGVREYVLDTEGKMLPETVPPGPDNPMGPVKFTLSFTASDTAPVSSLHGTNHPEFIGKRATSGCIHLRNERVLALADVIEPLFRAGSEIRVVYTMTLKGEWVAVASQ